jgi:hypothetical protein
MSEVTREDKMNKILEYWNESWESGDFSEIMDELEGLHNGEKRLCDWSDEHLLNEYHIALKYLKENA